MFTEDELGGCRGGKVGVASLETRFGDWRGDRIGDGEVLKFEFGDLETGVASPIHHTHCCMAYLVPLKWIRCYWCKYTRHTRTSGRT